MEQEFEQSNVKLRTRTPRNKELDGAVRESLLSDSTSGIVKGEGDDMTSVGSSPFSSPDLESRRENKDDSRPNGKEHRGLRKQSKIDQVTIIENPGLEEEALIESAAEKGDTETEKRKAKIPDGGWGWVVVLSSFVISMIADGISFSFGLLFIEFLEEFKASKSTTAWIGSLFIAVPLLSGPVMSALVDRYGCRSMTILGGIISSIGFILASISNSLEMMMLTFGVIAGLGLGLVYVTAVVSIAYWFEKKRNLAVGLGACGTGVGTFVFAPMTTYFIEEYGWRGTILLLSGTLLNLCVCGCVMRDPEWWTEEQKRQEKTDDDRSKKEENKVSDNDALYFKALRTGLDAPTQGLRMKAMVDAGVPPDMVVHIETTGIKRRRNMLMLMKNSFQEPPRRSSVENIPSYLTMTDAASLYLLDFVVKGTSYEYGIEVKYPKFAINRNSAQKPAVTEPSLDNDPPVVTFPAEEFQKLTRTYSDCTYNHEPEDKSTDGLRLKNPKQSVYRRMTLEAKTDKKLLKQDSKENKRDWLKKQLSVNHHYLRDLKMPINSISHRNAILNTNRYRLKASSCPDLFKNSMITIDDKEEKWYADCVSCLADMFNVSLFKKMTFNLFCLSTIILFTWFIVPYFYLAEHMNLNGYNENDGGEILGFIGITNTIGMVTLGWVGDFPRVSIANLYAVCLLLCGVTVAAIPFAVPNLTLLIVDASAFGLLFAASFTFTPNLLVKLVSLDEFTSAYGLVLLAQGIGHLIGPPLAGLIYDVTLSWDLAFYLAGGWIMVAGVLIALLQPVISYQLRREEDKDSESSIA